MADRLVRDGGRPIVEGLGQESGREDALGSRRDAALLIDSQSPAAVLLVAGAAFVGMIEFMLCVVYVIV